MRKVYIVPTNDAGLDVAVADVMARVPCVEVVTAIDNAGIVAVVIGIKDFDYAAIAPMIEPAADGAFAVIGIYAPDHEGPLPEVLEDWATLGTYPLDADALTAAICDGDESWLGGDGETRPERKTRRHCR